MKARLARFMSILAAQAMMSWLHAAGWSWPALAAALGLLTTIYAGAAIEHGGVK